MNITATKTKRASAHICHEMIWRGAAYLLKATLNPCSAPKKHKVSSKSQPASCCGHPPLHSFPKLASGFKTHRLILPCAVPHHWYSSAQYRVKYSPQIIPKFACGQQTKAGLFGSCRKEAGLLTCRTPIQLNLEKLPNPSASAASADLLQIHTAGRKAGIN